MLLTVQICLTTNKEEQGNLLQTSNASIPYFRALHLDNLFYFYTFHVI